MALVGGMYALRGILSQDGSNDIDEVMGTGWASPMRLRRYIIDRCLDAIL